MKHLFLEAERARWTMHAIPCSELRRDRVTPELIDLVRTIAGSELTTFSATQRFLQDFSDDVDFTSWLAVWFYEETKHPLALLRWLEELGVTVDDDFVRRGRVTAPFLRSRMATLVMNIISEMIASARYMNLRATSPEPVLSRIAEHLAGDEARHAASFFGFARARLARSADPAADRRDALKVLHLWASDEVRHPVNLFERPSAGLHEGALRSRVFHLIGYLIGESVSGIDDVKRLLM